MPAAQRVTLPVPAAGAVQRNEYAMTLALVVCVTAPLHELQDRTVPSAAAKTPARAAPKDVGAPPFTGDATKPFTATAEPASVTV